MFFEKKFKAYKRKQDQELNKKRSKQFVDMFQSVTRELDISGRSQNELKRMFELVGNTEDSSDVFLKIILLLHTVGGIGINTLKNTSTLEELTSLDLLTIFELLTDSWVIVGEMLQGFSSKVVAEPFLLYKSIRWYVSMLHIHKQRRDPRQNYYTRLDGSLGPKINLKVNSIDHEVPDQGDDPNDELYIASQDA